MIRRGKPASPRSCRAFKNWAGASAATSGSTTAGAAADGDRIRKNAAELVALAPDVILAVTSTVAGALQRETSAVPIVFVITIDPVGAGLVGSLARPGGNATGFTVFEYGFSPKWLELLKEIAPRVTHVGIIRNPTAAKGNRHAGRYPISRRLPLRVEFSLIDMRDVREIERASRRLRARAEWRSDRVFEWRGVLFFIAS